MDASPLAQINNRQQPPFVRSPDDSSPLWEASQQRQPIRPNPLQRGQFSRSFNSSFGSFSSRSANSGHALATSASSSATGYFDLRNPSKCDLLSPMASLTADMSANFSLDPRWSCSIHLLTVVRVQDFPRLVGLSSRPCHSDHSLVVGDNLFDPLPPMNSIHPPALMRTRLRTLRFLINYQQHNLSPPFPLLLFKTSRTEQTARCVLPSTDSRHNLFAQFQLNRATVGHQGHPLTSTHPYSKSQVCINSRFLRPWTRANLDCEWTTL